jgi:hypothetical protein
MHRSCWYLVCAILIIGLAGCSKKATYSLRTLPSGRAVKVAAIMPMNFSQGPAALVLKYYSDKDFDSHGELDAEADEIWQQFRIDVENAKFKEAILMASEEPHGIISHTKGFNYVFERQTDGKWVQFKGGKDGANKSPDPTPPSVTPAAGQPARQP